MKRKQKKFVAWCPTHIYQKGYQGRVLFYCLRDRLVYLSIFFEEARKRGVEVLAIALMFNHVHANIKVKDKAVLAGFNQAVQHRYAAARNRASGRKGPVFMRTYGWAQKRSDKDVCENLCYIANNSQKKRLFRRAVDDRWTLLAYGREDYPFSQPIALARARRPMRRAVSLVKACREMGTGLTYQLLDKLFTGLTPGESSQLADLIVQEYSEVNFEEAASYFGGFGKMLAAFEVTSGSEYEISEEFTPEPDVPYREMVKVVKAAGFDLVAKAFLGREELSRLFRRRTSASERQIVRFLHLRPENHTGLAGG